MIEEIPRAPQAVASRSKWLLPALIWIFVVGPYTVGDGYSSSFGPHVILILILAATQVNRRYGVGHVRPGLLIFITILSSHFILSFGSSPCTDMTEKSIASFLLFIIVIWALALLAEAVDVNFESNRTLLPLAGLVMSSVVIHYFILLLQGRTIFERASGIFPEPSHLALAITPILISLAFNGGLNVTVAAALAIVALIFIASSTTLILMLTLVFLFAILSKKHSSHPKISIFKYILPLISLMFAAWFSPYMDEGLARIAGVRDTDVGANPSSVIYVMGWEHALYNLEVTNYLGLGFNRMGCEPRPITDVTKIIEIMGLGDANYNDGSFTMAKIISEFGIPGVIIIFALIFQFIKMIRHDINSGNSRKNEGLIILLIGTITVQLLGGFVRGTGYFSGPLLAAIFSYFLLRRISTNTAPSRLRA